MGAGVRGVPAHPLDEAQLQRPNDIYFQEPGIGTSSPVALPRGDTLSISPKLLFARKFPAVVSETKGIAFHVQRGSRGRQGTFWVIWQL